MLVGAYLVARNRSENFFVRHAETKVCALTVFQAKHVVAHHSPAPRLFPNLARVQSGQVKLLTADAVHLFAQDLLDFKRDALGQGEQGIDARSQLPDESSAQQKLVRDDLCVGRVFAQCWDEIL